MPAKLDIDEPKLLLAYESGESTYAIAKRLGTGMNTIISRLHRLGVQSTKRREIELNLTPENVVPFREIVDGLMLGDGSIGVEGKLTVFQRIDREGWLIDIQRRLGILGCVAKIIPCKGKGNRKAGNLLYTRQYKELRSECARWYCNPPEEGGKRYKQVPKDVHISALSLALWFCGDGSGDRGGSFIFHTEGFTKMEVGFLADTLSNTFEVSAVIGREKRPDQFLLGVYRQGDALKLMEIMNPYVPKCCAYKLRFARPARWCVKLSDAQAREVWTRAHRGEGVTLLAREFSVGRATIYRLLRGESYKFLKLKEQP